MKILVFESATRLTGHRIPYASLVARAFETDEVIVALPQVLSNEPSLAEYFCSGQLKFYETNIRRSFFAQAWESSRCLFQLIQELCPDRVLVPTADGMAVMGWAAKRYFRCGRDCPSLDIALMVGRRPEVGMGLREKVLNRLKWWSILCGPWQRLMLMDPRSFCELGLNQRVILSPDPVPALQAYDKTEARRQLGIECDGRLVVSAGNQNARKGVGELINAFCDAEIGDQDRLLLIGSFSKEIRLLIAGMRDSFRGRQLICRDQFVSDVEFSQAIVAADLVAAPYRDTERPSGVISRCIAWGVPFWGSESGWPGWAMRQFDAGYPVRRSTPESIACSLAAALDQCKQFTQCDRARLFAEFNSAENYQSVWRESLPLDSSLRTLSAETFLDAKS
ncbi:glycosyltransferase [Stieleria sp. TO1_6]|uniref:glycosyltransferase n=1 Tax=Stieleria tagensis TaxID=2956795 RepID=UPI00209A6C91|nr:glycosyltransferase [Stieleria tagensis]MCO8123449.1 glycosyltransferase [Stieleria tagensis]